MKNVLILNGHPVRGSLNDSLAEAYQAGAIQKGHSVELFHLSALEFNPELSGAYQKSTELEPDLQLMQEKIRWCNHLVFVHPVWWGGLPAKMKGFIDRVFLPGFAFRYKKDSVWWDRLLAGRSGQIICTLDQPYWYYWLINGRPGIHQLKKMTMEFCGIQPVSVLAFGPVRNADPQTIQSWIQKTKQKGNSL